MLMTFTTVTFLRDATIFTEDNTFKFDLLLQRFREMAFITRGVTIFFKDERDDAAGGGREMTFYFEDGISAFVRYLNRNKEALHTVPGESTKSAAPQEAKLTVATPRIVPARNGRATC